MTDLFENTEIDNENETEKTITDEHANAAENTKSKKPAKRKSTSIPKSKKTCADKKAALVEQQKKLMEAQNANKKKGKDIDSQLAEVSGKIRDIEIGELEKVCAKLNITIPALTDFLEKLPNGKKLTYGDLGDLPPATEKENSNDNG